MYNPSHFAESRKGVLHDLIVHYPLGALITFGAQGLDANHIPFELDSAVGELGRLRAHVARQSDVWKMMGNAAEVLVVFRAEDAYISPNWYPSKHEFHKQVPTWNYRVVHAHGRITIHDDERYVRSLVARLTRHHEASQPTPWKMGDAPQDYIDTMLKAIVGIEIDITRLVGKFKLSQNREARDRLGAADALIACGDGVLGQAMRETLPPTK
jgi:transcriptional regulator